MAKSSAPSASTQQSSSAHSAGGTSLAPQNLLGIVDSLLCPLSWMAALALVALACGESLAPPRGAPYWMLFLLVFALTYPGNLRLHSPPLQLVGDIVLNWLWIAALLWLAGKASGYQSEFPQQVLLHWMWAAPTAEVLATLLMRAAAPTVLRLQGPRQRAILVGMNEQALAFGNKLLTERLSRIELLGYVDSRNATRLENPELRHLGTLEQIASLVQSHGVQLIYLSLPMTSQPRILQALDALKDTTASIYFVPDMFVTDLIQGQAGAVCGTAVIAVCESPFTGFNGVVKRLSDIVFSIVILLLISPLLVGIAVAIKYSTRGPVLFKQLRYGLDGQEIVVYKFRSMTVADDGANVVQASRTDKRITPLGALLRRTSLDELPQFVNVLQGRMSIVGPRPHAVAHNEFYRKQIKGYMVRHKVKPGITGWAQVNGFRGETETLDKMQGRINCDLDYLRHWSLALDTRIIFRTIRLVLKDHKAY